MNHSEKINWMKEWAEQNGATLSLDGTCGMARECVGILRKGKYPDYDDEDGEIWCPDDAYHKHDCVAVLGHGEKAEAQLYDWLKWFDENGYTTHDEPITPDPNLPMELILALGKGDLVCMLKK